MVKAKAFGLYVQESSLQPFEGDTCFGTPFMSPAGKLPPFETSPYSTG